MRWIIASVIVSVIESVMVVFVKLCLTVYKGWRPFDFRPRTDPHNIASRHLRAGDIPVHEEPDRDQKWRHGYSSRHESAFSKVSMMLASLGGSLSPARRISLNSTSATRTEMTASPYATICRAIASSFTVRALRR